MSSSPPRTLEAGRPRRPVSRRRHADCPRPRAESRACFWAMAGARGSKRLHMGRFALRLRVGVGPAPPGGRTAGARENMDPVERDGAAPESKHMPSPRTSTLTPLTHLTSCWRRSPVGQGVDPRARRRRTSPRRWAVRSADRGSRGPKPRAMHGLTRWCPQCKTQSSAAASRHKRECKPPGHAPADSIDCRRRGASPQPPC